MLNEERLTSPSILRHEFGIFFDRVRELYNLSFLKEEQSSKVKDVNRYADELFQANRISEYIRSIIGEAIEKFALLLPSNLKKMAPNLDHLEQWISISIYDINGEINDLMSR